MKNLLAIIREPEGADNFIGYAAKLSEELNSHLHLSYILEEYEYTLGQPPAPANYTGDQQSKKVELARDVLSERINIVLGGMRNKVSLDFSAEMASITSVIDEYIMANHPDMVLFEAEEPEVTFSTVTSNEEISNELRNPVLLVPRDAVYRSLRQVVYATAINENDIDALNDLIRILSELSPSIRVLHVAGRSGPGEQLSKINFVERLKKETRYSNITVEYLQEEKDESLQQQIMHYALQVNAGLVAVLKQERNFFERIFSQDTTKKLMKHSDIPVLIYK